MQRTQTSNLPDPYDPAPIDQGINVAYTSLLYGGVSFAIVERPQVEVRSHGGVAAR